MTRTVADTALLMGVGAASPELAGAAAKPPAELRVGYSVKPALAARVDR